MLWDVPEDVGFLLDEATVLIVTTKGRSCVVFVLLTLPLLCAKIMQLMTNLEGSPFGGHVRTFHVTFTVETFLSSKPGQICVQVFLLTRTVMHHIMTFRSMTDCIYYYYY